MKKQFIVNTPFGIGVATSEEDLKDMLSFVEGIAGEGAERSEAQQEEACDCENCQHNARASEEKLTLFSLFLSSVDELATLAFIEKDLTSDMNATFLALGEGHPQVIHFEKMLDLLKERIAEVSSEDAVPDAQLSEEQLLERLSEDIAHVNKVENLEVLNSFREFMTTVLESDNPNKKREAELLIGKIDERIAELTGGSDADKVEDKSAWEKRDPSLLGLYHVSSTVDTGANILASVDLGYTVDKEEMVHFVRQSTEILNELLKSEVENMDAPEAPAEYPPEEEPLPTLEEIKAMTDYDEVGKVQIRLEEELSRLVDEKRATIDKLHAEMNRIENLHTAAANQEAVILDNKADIAHADMADKVKALQEAITRGGEHLLIHEDIHEAMEILRERYSKQ